MSKQTFFKRYILLFDLIRNNKYISYEEINERLGKSELKEITDVGFSKRTFHRDQLEIQELFGIEIKYDKTNKGYYVENSLMSSNNELLIDSYRFVNTYHSFKQ
jgi:proteasome accessory factor B